MVSKSTVKEILKDAKSDIIKTINLLDAKPVSRDEILKKLNSARKSIDSVRVILEEEVLPKLKESTPAPKVEEKEEETVSGDFDF
jgi:uncharacterized protein YjgD (DUF1641 family)